MDKPSNKIFAFLLGAIVSIGFSNLAMADDACKAKQNVRSNLKVVQKNVMGILIAH